MMSSLGAWAPLPSHRPLEVTGVDCWSPNPLIADIGKHIDAVGIAPAHMEAARTMCRTIAIGLQSKHAPHETLCVLT